MSPGFVIDRFVKITETYGNHLAISDRKFKREREAFISAVWSLGVRKNITATEYWIEIETRDQTPDCKVHFFDTSSGDRQHYVLNMEVAEWEPHRDDPFEIISDKCAKYYPKYFHLLMLARNGKPIEPPELLSQLRTLKRIPFSEMWIIGRMSLNDNREWGIFKIHPEHWMGEFDLLEALKEFQNQLPFVELTGRGRGVELKSLGYCYLPLP